MALSQSQDQDTIVSTHEGFVITKSGLVTSSSETLTTSFILKIPTFSIQMPDMLCFTKSHDTEQVKAANAKFNEKFAALNKSHSEFLSSRLSALSPFVQHKSQKRSIFIAALSTLFGGALVGITEAQIYSIKSHVSSNEQAISSLQRKVKTISGRQILFEKETIAFLKEFSERTQIALEFEHCLDELESFYSNALTSFTEYKRSIDVLFDAQLRGINYYPLSAKLLDLFTLSRIVEVHESFNHQLYKEHPSLLYNVARLALISVNDDLSLAHFVMSFPSLISHRHYPLYVIRHTGIYLEEGLCARLDSPGIVFVKNNSFYAIKLELCSSNFDFHICPPEAFSVRLSCLQRHSSFCNITKSECDSPNTAVNLPNGILLRNNKLHDTFRRDFRDKTHPIKLSPLHTAFVSWNQTTHIQVGESLFVAPNFMDIEIEFKNFSTNFLFNPYLISVNDLIIAFDNYTRRYNRSLQSLLTPPEDPIASTHLYVLTAVVAVCVIVCCVALAFSFAVYRHYSGSGSQDQNSDKNLVGFPAPSEYVPEKRNSI